MEADFEEMESRLMYLENLCVQCEQQRFKHFQVLQLENYKKKKRCGIFSLLKHLSISPPFPHVSIFTSCMKTPAQPQHV